MYKWVNLLEKPTMLQSLLSQFVDIIEWNEAAGQTLVYRFPRYQDEIKNGAKLIVRPGQLALLVSEGQVGDTYQPGTYELTTRNMPITTTLSSWMYKFESPFKVEVYFFSTRVFNNLKWGTPTPIIKRDAELGVVRLRSRGHFGARLFASPATILTELVGTKPSFTMDDVMELLRSSIVMSFGDMVASDQVALYDLATQYQDYADELLKQSNDRLKLAGFEVLNITIEGITVPEEVEALIDKRSGMGITGSASFLNLQGALSLTDDGAGNASIAKDAVGLGIGVAMANQVLTQVNQQQAGAATPPPLPTDATFYWAEGTHRHGPVSFSEMEALMASFKVSRETLVWQEGMGQWAKAETLPQLAQVLQKFPPSL